MVLVNDLFITLSLQLIEKYGNIFSVRIGSDKIVYVSGFKMVKDVLITQGENFTDRPVSPLFDTLYKGRGKCSSYTTWNQITTNKVTNVYVLHPGLTINPMTPIHLHIFCRCHLLEKAAFSLFIENSRIAHPHII